MIRTYGKKQPYQGKEDAFQIAACNLLGYQFPTLEWFHPPNGGLRNKAVGSKLKKQGVKAGVSDLIIQTPSGPYHGACIELKVKGGRLSPDQKAFLNRNIKLGHFCAVVYSIDGLKQCLVEYLAIEERGFLHYREAA